MGDFPWFNMQQLNLDWLLEKIKSGEYLSADSALSLTSKNPVQNKILTAAVNELNAKRVNSILQAPVKAVTANGSTNNTLRGLTENHVVGNWGLFSDAACTTPIPVNQPTCDITISTSADAWTLTIANFSSTFYIKPSFILKQN